MKIKPAVVNTIHTVIHAICFIGLSLLCMLSTNKYEWMREMDATMENLPEDSGNTKFFAFLILAFIVLLQSINIVIAQSKWHRFLSVAFIVIACFVCVVRFLYA